MGSYLERPDKGSRLETKHAGKVLIVDDDPLILATLEHTLWLSGIESVKFLSAEQLLSYVHEVACGCVLTDFRLPGMNGIELQEELTQRYCALPVIVMTGFADVPLAVRATKAGAMDILQKPFKNEQLLLLVRAAFVVADERRLRNGEREAVERQLNNLSSRERDVLRGVISGCSNKEIARRLGLSPRTIESHRARVMEKMEVESLAALIEKATANKGPSSQRIHLDER